MSTVMLPIGKQPLTLLLNEMLQREIIFPPTHRAFEHGCRRLLLPFKVVPSNGVNHCTVAHNTRFIKTASCLMTGSMLND